MKSETFTKVNKFPKSKGKKSTTTYEGRMEKIDPDLYYKTRDENISLKKRLTELESENKKLEVTLQKLKVNSQDKISNIDIETLKIENENLKNKNMKMRQIIQGLKKELNSKNKTSKFLFKNKNNYSSKSEKEDYLNLISHLQNELKNAYEDRRNLIDDLTAIKESKSSSTIVSYSDDLREKNTQLSELKIKYDLMKNSLEANNKILEATKESLKDFSDKYQSEKNKNKELELIINNQNSSIDKIKDYIEQIDQYKERENLLEERIKDLSENPFIKQANERDKAFEKLRETQIALSEEQRKLKNAEDKIQKLENLINELENKNNLLKEEKDKYKEDGLRYKISVEEKEKQNKDFEDTFKRMSQFGEVDSNYNKMINMLKGTNLMEDSDNNVWKKINFFDKKNENEEPQNMNELLEENEKLKIEKGILGNELEKTKELLVLQQQINNDMKKVIEIDKEKYKKEIKYLKEENQSLKELLGKEKIPNEYKEQNVLDNISISKDIEKEKEKEINILRQSNISVDSKITGFSISSESDYGINENALDLYITNSIFDRNTVENKLNIPLENLVSFISVDFYLHDTQTSNLINGPKSNYNLQLTFKVDVDEYFINYLKSDNIIVYLYTIQNNIQKIIASGKIKLSQLIQAENNPKSRVIHGYIEMFLESDSSFKLCDIKYKMRMRKTLKQMLNWLNDRNNLANELSPLNEANNNIYQENLIGKNYNNPEKEIIEYYNNNSGNRVFSITINIIKAENLKISYPSKKINPYIYYNFYRNNEHYSKILNDPDDELNDVAQFTCIYNNIFHQYLSNETLDIYIFDGSKPIQVDIGKEVSMVNDENKDVIGICKINLKSLMLAGKIEGKFAILNESLSHQVGFLIINITSQQINNIEENNKNINITISQKGVDPLLIKLAEFLRNKGLNMNSAFNLLDSYNEGCITLDSFRNVLWSIQFTNSNQEITQLVKIIFDSKPRIYQDDFCRVFDGLLPEGNLNKTNNSGFTKSNFYENIIDKNDNMQFMIGNQNNNNDNKNSILKSNRIFRNSSGRNEFAESSNVYNSSYYNDNNYYKSKNDNNNNNDYNDYNGNNSRFKQFNELRDIREIMREVNEIMIQYGSNDALSLYKKLDFDENTSIDKKELLTGFGKLGIFLTHQELDMIWNEIVGGNPQIKEFTFTQFRAFYNKHKYYPENTSTSKINY